MTSVSNVFSVSEVAKTYNFNYPKSEHIQRLQNYDIYHNLFRGNHEYVFINSGRFKYTYDNNREYFCMNLCGAYVRLVVSRLFGEEIYLHVEDKSTLNFLNYVMADTGLQKKNICAARGCSYRGDAVYKIRYDGLERKIKVDIINPDICYPETDPLDSTKIVKITICNLLVKQNDKKKEYYLWEEIHEMRGSTSWILNKLYRAEKSKNNDTYLVDYENELPLDIIPETAGLVPEVNTGVSDLLVIWVANDADDSGSIYGISDYEDLIHIQGELNNRYIQRAEILDKHTDPFLTGPEDLMDDFGNVDIGRNNKFIPLRDGENPDVVRYITWDPKLDSVEKEIDELIRNFASVAMIDHHVLVDIASGGNPPSGRALKLAQSRTQTRVKSKQLTFGDALRKLFSRITRLAQLVSLDWSGIIVPLNENEISIGFSDGLPDDSMQNIEEQVAMVEGGVQSKVRAIAKLHKISIDEAQVILSEIEEEQKIGAMELPSFEQIPLDLGNE